MVSSLSSVHAPACVGVPHASPTVSLGLVTHAPAVLSVEHVCSFIHIDSASVDELLRALAFAGRTVEVHVVVRAGPG